MSNPNTDGANSPLCLALKRKQEGYSWVDKDVLSFQWEPTFRDDKKVFWDFEGVLRQNVFHQLPLANAFQAGTWDNGMKIWLIYPLIQYVTTKWYYLCFMSLNVFCMLLSVLPLTLRHKGACLHLAADCRQCEKAETGRSAAEGCHSQQQALIW